MQSIRQHPIRWAASACGLCLLAFAVWSILGSREPAAEVAPDAASAIIATPTQAPAIASDQSEPPPSLRPDGRPQGSPLGEQLHHPDNSPRDDLEIVHQLLQTFRLATRQSGARPMSFNEEFTAALTGENTLGLPFLRPSHPAINEHGQLTDRWGTPLHFHPLAHDRIELRSAGPDRRLFTEDDIIK